MKTKLSPTQIKVLRALAEPGGNVKYLTGINPSCYMSSTMETLRFSTMDKLIALRFVETEKDFMARDKIATITPAGREYLAGLDKEAL